MSCSNNQALYMTAIDSKDVVRLEKSDAIILRFEGDEEESDFSEVIADTTMLLFEGNETEIDVHMDVLEEEEENQCPFPDCDSSPMNADSTGLIEHVLNVHVGFNLFNCQHCPKLSFATPQELAVHCQNVGHVDGLKVVARQAPLTENETGCLLYALQSLLKMPTFNKAALVAYFPFDTDVLMDMVEQCDVHMIVVEEEEDEDTDDD